MRAKLTSMMVWSTPHMTLLEQWLASMDQKDRIIHDLAVRMLKTRYDPTRCNAFLNFVAAQKK